MEELLKVLFLGIVEGITEYLPVSSTGHLILASELVQLSESLKGSFEIFIQIGAVVAVIAYYRAELFAQVRHVRTHADVRHLWLAIVTAFVPAALIGFFLNDWITETLFSPVNVAIALIAGGILFLLVERFAPIAPSPATREAVEEGVQKITFRQALLIGAWQILALIPGMSRSGMSIMGGVLLGLNRSVATQFSFYLAIPTLGMATIYSFVKDLNNILAEGSLGLFLLGAVVAGIVSWVAIAWLLRYLVTHTFVPFGVYRIGLGLLILVLALT